MATADAEKAERRIARHEMSAAAAASQISRP